MNIIVKSYFTFKKRSERILNQVKLLKPFSFSLIPWNSNGTKSNGLPSKIDFYQISAVEVHLVQQYLIQGILYFNISMKDNVFK